MQLQALADLDARLGEEEEESVAGDGSHVDGFSAARGDGRGGGLTGKAAGTQNGSRAPAVEPTDSNGSMLRMERDLDAFLASVEGGEQGGGHGLTAGDISLANAHIEENDSDDDQMDFGDV